MTRAAAKLARLCIAFVMFAAAPLAAQSDHETSARLDALFGAHQPYEAFLAQLKEAVVAQDKEAVAAMIAYPLATRIAGVPVTLASEEEFLRRYEELITPPVVAAVRHQTWATLFANAEGVMVGDGAIWFSGVCGDDACADVAVRIIAINPAAGQQADAPGDAQGSDR